MLLDYLKDEDHPKHSYILSDKKVFYFRIPKLAGTTITVHGAHWRSADESDWINIITEDEFKKYFKFLFVRNPYDRIISLWNNFINRKREGIKIPKCTFREFLEKDYIKQNKHIIFHSIPQYKYVEYKGKRMDEINFIGRFEYFKRDWKIIADKFDLMEVLPVKNRNKHRHYSTYYDDWCVDKVTEMYKKDIELFNYKFERADDK